MKHSTHRGYRPTESKYKGGATYAQTVEWYEQHDVAHPEFAAGATAYAWHLLTEIVENGPHCCEDEDGLTDLMLFDVASIVLFTATPPGIATPNVGCSLIDSARR